MEPNHVVTLYIESTRIYGYKLLYPLYIYLYFQNNSYKTDNDDAVVASVGRLQVHRESGSLLVVAARQRRVVTKGTCFTFCRAQCAHTHTYTNTLTIYMFSLTPARDNVEDLPRGRCSAVASGPAVSLSQHVVIFLFLLSSSSSSSSLLLLLISLSPYTLVGRTNSYHYTRVIARDDGGNKRILFTPFDCVRSRHVLCPRVRLGETNLI